MISDIHYVLNNRKIDPEVVRKQHDLTAQLTGRKERLSWLIKFLNENMVVVKVQQSFLQATFFATDSLTCRCPIGVGRNLQQMRRNYTQDINCGCGIMISSRKQMLLCIYILQCNNSFLRTNPMYSILHDAVHAYMEESGEAEHEDVVRAFFRLKIGDIGRLIKKVSYVTTQASRATGRNMIEFLPEANRVVLVSFSAHARLDLYFWC
jgi:nuclear pore complex protein Nup133